MQHFKFLFRFYMKTAALLSQKNYAKLAFRPTVHNNQFLMLTDFGFHRFKQI